MSHTTAAYEQQNKMPDAFAAFENARKLDQDHAEIWSALGHAYAVSGNRANHGGATRRKSERGQKGPFQNRMNHAVSPVHIPLAHVLPSQQREWREQITGRLHGVRRVFQSKRARCCMALSNSFW